MGTHAPGLHDRDTTTGSSRDRQEEEEHGDERRNELSVKEMEHMGHGQRSKRRTRTQPPRKSQGRTPERQEAEQGDAGEQGEKEEEAVGEHIEKSGNAIVVKRHRLQENAALEHKLIKDVVNQSPQGLLHMSGLGREGRSLR